MSRARSRPSEFIGPPLHLSNAHVLQRVADNCKPCHCCGEPWHWTGRQYGHALPLMNVNKSMVSVRKTAYLANGGKPPGKGQLIVGLCENPACMNPELSGLRTRQWVIKRAVAAGKIHTPAAAAKIAAHRRGTGKLSGEAEADRIRSADPAEIQSLCTEIGISRQMAWRIRTGLSWRQYGSPWAGLGARA